MAQNGDNNGLNKKGFNRRDFLKIIGASSTVAAAGCGKELPEKIIPYVIQPDEIVPGVANWYSGNCDQCSSACGVLVKVREGRAIKVEGNPNHPVNKGGLCAMAQSSLQELYDPDRVRTPLKRDVNGAFQSISWEEAVNTIKEALDASGSAGQESVLLTNPLTGSLRGLVDRFTSSVAGSRHLEYELLSSDVIDLAAEQSFGAGTRTRFDFSKADVIVSVGADFLETWISPVEFTKAWAKRRSPGDEQMSYFAQIEPRLSQTAGNADRWVRNNPGSESAVLLALLKEIVSRSKKAGVSGAAKSQIEKLVADVDSGAIATSSGVDKRIVGDLAERLVRAPSSLVVAGGSSASGPNAKNAALLANLINAYLGNVGETVILSRSTRGKAKSSYEDILELTKELSAEKSKIGIVFISGTNPIYSLPKNSGFREGLAKAGLVVSLSTSLDETAKLAHLVLPASTNFESWSDSEPLPGVFGLNQPAMQPLYKSLSLGDLLLAIGSGKLGKSLEKTESYYDYLRDQWKKRTGANNFEERWLGYVEAGGDFSKGASPKKSATLAKGAFALEIKEVLSGKEKGLTLVAFPTITAGDGRGANRPWMQELPNPLTTAVWGSWIEMHPLTAAKHGIKSGSVVQIGSEGGSLEAPVYLNKHIHPQLLAVPIGQGHQGYGRYASGVGVNVLSLLPAAAAGSGMAFRTSITKVAKTIAREELVQTQGSDTQFDRGMIRSIKLSKYSEKSHGKDHGHGKGHGDSHGHGGHHHKGWARSHGGHHDLTALGPQKPPRQMYNQMPSQLYEWGMNIDLANCTGCSACVVACYAENNVPVVGKEFCAQGREMSWVRIDRYFDGPAEQPVDGFLPMMCQHCNNAGCEVVCPVYATYHNDQGLNVMVYNRCVGTRYCSNNCSYKVRRFNWYRYDLPEPLTWQLNPDVTVRGVGVMEKCSMCIQRIREGENRAKNLGRPVQEGEIQPACASSCPADAITFGNLLDKKSEVYQKTQSQRAYKVLDSVINSQPSVSYLARVRNDKGATEA